MFVCLFVCLLFPDQVNNLYNYQYIQSGDTVNLGKQLNQTKDTEVSFTIK